MSSRYGDKHGGDRYDSRRSSSSRRDSPPRHRNRRSRTPSPGPSRPRDPETLPESFGRQEDSSRVDDDLGVLQRMKASYENSPLHSLYKYLLNKDKVKIWTRNYKEVRGVMTGYIVAFDKHWNIVLSDVDEVFLKFKKSKTPFLREVATNENLPDMPVKVPKKKLQEKVKTEPKPQSEPPKNESEKKRRKRAKKPKATSEKRQSKMLFIRGDNIVIISKAVDDDDDDDEEEEVEEGEHTTVEIKTESG